MSYDPTIEADEWTEEILVEDDSDQEEADFNDESGELVEYSGEGDVDPVFIETPSGDVIDIANPELTYEEARELTDHIRATADMLYVLISRAHAGKAWKALGYDSFKDYVKEEFNISRSRAYQLLDQARVVEEITAIAPEGAQFTITEADARDVKSALDELVPEIKERTENLDDDEDAGAIIEDLIKDFRERKSEEEANLGGDGESYPEEYEGDLADRQGFADYSGGGSFDGGGYDDDEDDDLNDDEIDALLDFTEDPADVRRRFESVYALYTSLSSLKEMPSVEEVIPWIPEERRMQISSSLPHALAWLQEFSSAWSDSNGEAAEESGEETEEDDFSAGDDDVDELFDDVR